VHGPADAASEPLRRIEKSPGRSGRGSTSAITSAVDLPEPFAQHSILPPAITAAVMMPRVVMVPVAYLQDCAAFPGAGLQRRQDSDRRRRMCDGE
jgi:hypothetical protein